MPLADSDLVDDIVPDSTVGANIYNADNTTATNICTSDVSDAHHDYQLFTPMSNVTESTSIDESTDDSPISSPDRTDVKKIDTTKPVVTIENDNHRANDTEAPYEDQLFTPMSNVTESTTTDVSTDDTNVASPVSAYKDITIPTSEQQQQQPMMTSELTVPTISNGPPPPASVYVGKKVYALRLPGIGKVLAVNSEQSCDVDDLYEEEKKACDVDAFVDQIDDSTDEDDDSDLPLYTSTFRSHNVGNEYDVEANRSSQTSIIRKVDPPLDPSCDPFAQRTGKTLSWRDVNMKLQTRNGEKAILNNVWGEVPSTETTAIMGASGAGKTSLLNILAGRARTRGKVRIEADVRLQNYTVDPTSIKIRKSIAFVAQDDSLQITATPREAIRFSAKLRLPRSTTDSQLDMLTTRMLHELGLSSCADTIVGGPLIKGLSGGERKRASVGVELVVKPAMVFLDEPTSGLDSFSSVQVCQVLKKVANSGASVLFTIHQPSSEIFNSFDRLILLHKGRVLFQGPVKDVPLSFATCGYPVPINFNPADWVVNVAQKYPIPDLERAGFFQDDHREVVPPTAPLKGQNLLGEPITNRLNSIMGKNDDNDDKTPGLWAQVKLLYGRELTYMYRFPLPLYARFGFTAFLSFLIGIIFWKVGDASQADPFNITSQFGALMILLMLGMLGTAQPALLFFPEERPIFLREYSTDHYSVMSYFVSRLLVEMMNTGIQIFIMATLIYFMVSFNGSYWIFLGTTYALAMSGTAMAVMLGVLAEGNAKVAQQLLPLLFIPQLLFSGFFVSPSLMPSYLQWAQYVCVLTYAVRILIVEEFYECSDNPTENRNCQNLVENVRAEPGQLLFYWTMLVVYFIVFRTLALFLLRRSATKFY